MLVPHWLDPELFLKRLAAEETVKRTKRTDAFGNPINKHENHFDTQRQALVIPGTSLKSSFILKKANTEIKITSKHFPNFLNEPYDFKEKRFYLFFFKKAPKTLKTYKKEASQFRHARKKIIF